VHADQRIRAFVFLSRAEGLSLQAIADEMTARRWPTRQRDRSILERSHHKG
jgi:hypothetical protein